jgi:hypothetical protein
MDDTRGGNVSLTQPHPWIGLAPVRNPAWVEAIAGHR